ncbi:hypothetical protein Fcan01_23849 [Folsomia candida]|uniref:Uncharacterized protein n=1 Tax=Folsomia candida TaxID=158441 RepID=A0A226D7G8_FOLCA|nr:hypothetical protein Fcan01_23849 [Folsomia candida]
MKTFIILLFFVAMAMAAPQVEFGSFSAGSNTDSENVLSGAFGIGSGYGGGEEINGGMVRSAGNDCCWNSEPKRLHQSRHPGGKDYTRWIEIATVVHLYFNDPDAIYKRNGANLVQKTFITSTKNVYVFIIANPSNAGVDLEVKFMKTILTENMIDIIPWYDIQNFAFLFFHQAENRSSYKLCVHTTRSKPILEQTVCGVFRDGNILKKYQKLATFSCIWEYVHGVGTLFDKDNILIPTDELQSDMQNPFDTKQWSNMHIYMAKLILGKSNSTIVLVHLHNNYHSPIIKSEIVHLDARFASVVTKSRSLNFLSCYEDKYISFQFYLTPFPSSLWVAVLTTLTILIVLMTVYKLIALPTDVTLFTSIWLPFVAILLDDATSVPKKVEVSQFFRIIFSAWCPAAVLLTNCYSSLMISELNAPLRGYTPDTFEDVICEKSLLSKHTGFYVNITDMNFSMILENWDKVRDPFESTDPNCFRFIMVQDHSCEGIPSFAYFQNDISYWVKKIRTNRIRRDELIEFLTLSPKHILASREMAKFLKASGRSFANMAEYQGYAEKGLSHCEKSILIGENNQIDIEFEYYRGKYPHRKFYKGRGNMRPGSRAWTFEGGGGSRVLNYFVGLVESGIYSRLEEEISRRIYTKRG